VNNLIVWANVCSSQFKNARAWYFVSRYPSLTTSSGNSKGYQLIWNFFATRHKKGEVDGAKALLKWEVRKEHLKHGRVFFLNAAKVVAHLRGKANKYHVIHPKARQHINKFFNKMKVGDIDRIRHLDCSTMKGSQSKHQVHSLSSKNTTLLVLLIVLFLC
jgi:hypothetical protein